MYAAQKYISYLYMCSARLIQISFLGFSNTASLPSISLSYSTCYLCQHSLSPSTPHALPLHCSVLQAWRPPCSFRNFSFQFNFYGLGCFYSQQWLLCFSYQPMIMMHPMKFCSPKTVYPIWKATTLSALRLFFPKLCLKSCVTHISLYCSDSGTALHKGSMSLVASNVNSHFRILLSPSFSWSWGRQAVTADAQAMICSWFVWHWLMTCFCWLKLRMEWNWCDFCISWENKINSETSKFQTDVQGTF